MFQALGLAPQEEESAEEPVEERAPYDPFADVAAARAEARAAPDDSEVVFHYLTELARFRSSRDKPELEWTASVAEIGVMIDGLVAADHPHSAEMLAHKFRLLQIDGTDPQVELDAAIAAHAYLPTGKTSRYLVEAHKHIGTEAKQIVKLCEELYDPQPTLDDRVQLLYRCLEIEGLTGKREKDLKFVDKRTWAAYDEYIARSLEEAAERGRQMQADNERRRAERDAADSAASSSASSSSSSSSSGSGGSSSAPAAFVRVNLRSECKKTVKVFFGKSTYGSGRTSSISYNSSKGESMRPGDMLWILDDNGKELSNFTASASISEATINASCTGWSVR